MYYRKTHISVVLLLMVMLAVACGSKDKKEETTGVSHEQAEDQGSLREELPSHNGVRSIKVRNIGALPTVFNDSNYLQLQSAMQLGIDPIESLSSAYFMKRPIVKIESNELYHIDSLRHSLPYLVPEAAQLLEDIGRNFIDSLHSRGGDSYTIKVTSLLRTPENVSRLRKVNVNATDSSTHQFATTFDISYTNFYCLDENRVINQGDLKNLLAEVLNDLRNQKRCYVKFEKKTSCFHVTVR